MTLSREEAELFYDAADDFFGLWESIAGMRSLFPNYSDTRLREVAEKTLRSLISKGWIALYRRKAFEPEGIPLAPHEVEAALANDENWQPPTAVGSDEICYSATEEGDHAYRTGKL